MGKLAGLSLQYLTTTPAEKLSEDWERLKQYNDYGPDMLAVLNNYGHSCAIDYNDSEKPKNTMR
jgi:hypothetical protein